MSQVELYRIDCPRCLAVLKFFDLPIFCVNGGHYTSVLDKASLSELHTLVCANTLEDVLKDLIATPMELVIFPSVDTGYSVRLHNHDQGTYSDLSDIYPSELSTTLREEAKELGLL